jgi:hypothetical protein
MPIRLFFALMLLLPGLASANLAAERLQSIRSQAFSVCNNLLVHYNPNQNDGDPRHAENYRQALQQLQQLVTQEQDPLLIQATRDMHQRIGGLERQPASNAYLYPMWINPILEVQARLDRHAAKRYVVTTPSDPRHQVLHRLGLDVARLQLLYQTRTFSSLAVYVMAMDDNTFPQLDQQIIQGFTTLEQDWQQHAAELSKLKRKYNFVRPRLLKHEQGWVPGSAAYYLGQVTAGLAQLDTE